MSSATPVRFVFRAQLLAHVCPLVSCYSERYLQVTARVPSLQGALQEYISLRTGAKIQVSEQDAEADVKVDELPLEAVRSIFKGWWPFIKKCTASMQPRLTAISAWLTKESQREMQEQKELAEKKKESELKEKAKKEAGAVVVKKEPRESKSPPAGAPSSTKPSDVVMKRKDGSDPGQESLDLKVGDAVIVSCRRANADYHGWKGRLGRVMKLLAKDRSGGARKFHTNSRKILNLLCFNGSWPPSYNQRHEGLRTNRRTPGG